MKMIDDNQHYFKIIAILMVILMGYLIYIFKTDVAGREPHVDPHKVLYNGGE